MILSLGCLLFFTHVYASDNSDLLVQTETAYDNNSECYKNNQVHFYNSETEKIESFKTNDELLNLFQTLSKNYPSIMEQNQTFEFIRPDIRSFLLKDLSSYPSIDQHEKFIYNLKFLLYRICTQEPVYHKDAYLTFLTYIKKDISAHFDQRCDYLKRFAWVATSIGIGVVPFVGLISSAYDGHVSLPGTLGPTIVCTTGNLITLFTYIWNLVDNKNAVQKINALKKNIEESSRENLV